MTSKFLYGFADLTPEQVQKLTTQLLDATSWAKLVAELQAGWTETLEIPTGLLGSNGVTTMALKIKDVPKTGVDYGQHLGPAKSKPVTGMVSSGKKTAGQPDTGTSGETQTVHPGVFTDGMQIVVAGGRTINLGNYESARVDVSITVPCEKQTLNDAYEWATNWVSEKLNDAVDEAKGVKKEA